MFINIITLFSRHTALIYAELSTCKFTQQSSAKLITADAFVGKNICCMYKCMHGNCWNLLRHKNNVFQWWE